MELVGYEDIEARSHEAKASLVVHCSKANNICNSLPKQLKKFKFFVEEVSERYEELNGELSDVDLKLQDLLHTIELSDKCDMYKSWQMINEIRDLRKQRRNIKDEKLVLSGIKSQGISYLSRSSVQKCVDGLSKRKYRIRIVEEDEES